MGIRSGTRWPTSHLQSPMALLEGAWRRAPDADPARLARDVETPGSTAPVSDRRARRRRALASVALSIGAWSVLGAVASPASADEGRQAGPPEWSTTAPTTWPGASRAEGDAAAVGPNPAATVDPLATTPAEAGVVPDTPAGEVPAAGLAAAPDEPTTVDPTTVDPAVDPTTVEPTTVDPTTVEATTVDPAVEPTTVNPTTVEPAVEPTTVHPTTEATATSGLHPGLADDGLGTAADVFPAAGAAATDQAAFSEGVPDPSPDECGAARATARLVSDSADLYGAPPCEAEPETAGGAPAIPCPDGAPQRINPSIAGYRPAADAPDLATAVEAPRMATEAAEPPPRLPMPSVLPIPPPLAEPGPPAQPVPPVQPVQLPLAPMPPPVLPGQGTAAGGCQSAVSAGAQHEAASPLAFVDPGGAAPLPTASNAFIFSLTPDVTARAADPGSRPT